MTEFTVCRTLDTHPALRYCLLLDDMRIAGGKPDYRGDNILISWRTKETYGPVNAIKTENSKLATEKAALERRIDELCAEVERGKAEFKKMDVWHSQELKAAMDENAKLRRLLSEAFQMMHRGGLTTGAYGRCMELFRDAQALGIEIPFMNELEAEVNE